MGEKQTFARDFDRNRFQCSNSDLFHVEHVCVSPVLVPQKQIDEKLLLSSHALDFQLLQATHFCNMVRFVELYYCTVFCTAIIDALSIKYFLCTSH